MTTEAASPAANAPRPARVPSRRPSASFIGALFVVPSFIILCLTTLVPIVMSAFYSFTQYSLLAPPVWRGLGNYVELTTDVNFANALVVTTIYTFGAVPLQTALAFVIAEAIARRFQNVFGQVVRSVLFVPVVSSLVVGAVVWRAALGSDAGLINRALAVFGIAPVNFLGNSTLALGAVILVTVWKNVGYFLVIYYAGIMAVPRELYEAAAVDGASRTQQMMNVTLPFVKPITLLVVILGTIWSFQVFDLVYVMTGGGPGGATTTIVMRLYRAGFQDLRMGYASAMAMILFAIIVVLAVVQRKVLTDD